MQHEMLRRVVAVVPDQLKLLGDNSSASLSVGLQRVETKVVDLSKESLEQACLRAFL